VVVVGRGVDEARHRRDIVTGKILVLLQDPRDTPRRGQWEWRVYDPGEDTPFEQGTETSKPYCLMSIEETIRRHRPLWIVL